MEIINKFESDCNKVIKIERPKYETNYEVKSILDKEEKEYLENVIRPFRKYVKYIVKNGCSRVESINIKFNDGDIMIFKDFKQGTMYKDMKRYKKYTLNELGLFEEENNLKMKKTKIYKYKLQKDIIDNLEKYDTYEYIRRLVVQICDKEEEIVYQQMIKDIKANPQKYDYDFVLMTRERIIELLKKGVEYEKMEKKND